MDQAEVQAAGGSITTTNISTMGKKIPKVLEHCAKSEVWLIILSEAMEILGRTAIFGSLIMLDYA